MPSEKRTTTSGNHKSFRVMMVAPTSFFSDYGGHIRILEETLALQALGHKVTIVTYYKGGDVPNLDIRRTQALPWHTEYEVGSSRHKLAFDLFLAVKVVQVGLQMRPDIIHAHMHEGTLIGGLLSRLLRVPLLFDFQGGLTGEMVDHGFLSPSGPLFAWTRRLEKIICHLPDAILTSSLRARKLLTEQFGVEPAIIHPLPDCVDTERFNPRRFRADEKEELQKRLGIPPSRPIVAYLGLLADYQGTHHLVQAAAKLKREGEDVHFLLMGYPRVEHYQALAKRSEVAERVTFTGKIPYPEAPSYLSLGDIAVSAKMSSTEGSGKVLNYMAMGQPVVAYDTPVHREYLGELGVYAPREDVDGLACAIGELLHDSERRAALGSKLRQRAEEQYSWQDAGREVMKLYELLTK